MRKITEWFRRSIKKEIEKAFKNNNVKKINDLSNMGYDVIDLLEFDEHPLIVSIKEERIPLVIYFIKKGINKKLLEESLILTKEKNLNDIEKLIIIHTQGVEKRKSYYKRRYSKTKRSERIINKSGI